MPASKCLSLLSRPPQAAALSLCNAFLLQRFRTMTPHSPVRTGALSFSLILLALTAGPGILTCQGQDKPAPASGPDVLILSNGDTLHGKFVSEIAGKVTFHSDPLGDISLDWDKIKELHTSQKFAVVDNKTKIDGKRAARKFPVGTLDLADQQLTLHPDNAPAEPPIQVKSAQFIMDQA